MKVLMVNLVIDKTWLGMRNMRPQNKQKLGGILVQIKKITEEQLKSVLKKQRTSGKRKYKYFKYIIGNNVQLIKGHSQ